MTPPKITRHAVEHYQERVRPTLPLEAVEAELTELVERHGTLIDDPPYWSDSVVLASDRYDAWLMVGDDIAFPILNGYAMTCIARGDAAGPDRGRRRQRYRKPHGRKDGDKRRPDRARRARLRQQREDGW